MRRGECLKRVDKAYREPDYPYQEVECTWKEGEEKEEEEENGCREGDWCCG